MLEARRIRKTFKNGKNTLEVLKGIDLRVKPGEFVAIVGPSGAGKSTLLHILGGLDSPCEGQVIIGSEDIYRLSDNALSKKRNEEIGFVFQFYHLLPEFNCLENVAMPLMVDNRNNKAEAKKRAVSLLKQVGLSDRQGHFPSQLSGGEKQRVAIARALINSPKFFFCDEPTGNLDSQTGGQIIRLIREAGSQNQLTVILVTHNAELAQTADRIFQLRDGVLV